MTLESADGREAILGRHIETAVRAEVTDNKLSSTAVAADLITPLWLPRRATNPAGRLCHCAHPEINPLTYSVADIRGGDDSVAVS